LGDLFVSPEHRNYGVGEAFFGEIAKLTEEKLDEARVQSYGWKQPSVGFYVKGLGAFTLAE
ncbi:uncharacterized protein PHACADRAFT_88840, partial [Phanerochaete carnosa HHB-10118-sp]